MKQQFAAYIPGLQAKDYAPIHGSVLKYVKTDEEAILLVLASPNYIREESYFQWVFIQLENNEIVSQETEPFLLIPEALDVVDENTDMEQLYREQKLPSIQRMQEELQKQLMMQRIGDSI